MVIGEVSIMNRLVASYRIVVGWPGAAALAACGAICVLAVLACRGDSGSATAWDGAVRDSAGIEIVENFGAPLWPEGPGWEFTEVLRIGAVEGAPEYQFGHITGFAVLSDGRIVVADAMAHHLRFFSPEGVYERTVGREGQGPGEFGSGRLVVHVGPGDTLLVRDGANARANVLAPDGTWLESFSTRPRDGYFVGYWVGNAMTGRLTSQHSPLRQSDGTLTDTLDIVLERDVHGAILDTLARLPSYMTFSAQDPAIMQHYYGVWWDQAPCGDDLVILHNERYRLRWYGPGAKLNRIASLARELLAITDEDRSVLIGLWDAMLRENRVPAQRAAEIKSGIRFAGAYPAFSWYACGPEATLLVQRVRPVRDLDAEELKAIRLSFGRAPGSSEWDVFDREGRYLGGVVIPGTEWANTVPRLFFFRDRANGSWYMYSLWRDELDVEYVVAWRIDGRMAE
jgi:hypothetical protein